MLASLPILSAMNHVRFCTLTACEGDSAELGPPVLLNSRVSGPQFQHLPLTSLGAEHGCMPTSHISKLSARWLSDLKFNMGTEGYPSVNHICVSVWIFPGDTVMCAINWIRERLLETFFLHHCPPIPEVSCFLPSETDITSCELL